MTQGPTTTETDRLFELLVDLEERFDGGAEAGRRSLEREDTLETWGGYLGKQTDTRSMAASVDERGRLYLPKDIREEYGEQFRIVRLHDGIKLLPVPEDPVEDLAEALEPLQDVPLEEIQETIEQEAMEDVLDDLR